MNTLIPVPRTDKNGRTVIRHMKADPSASGKASGIPKVAISKQAVSIVDAVALVDAHADGIWFMKQEQSVRVDATRIINRDMPTAVPLLTQLVESGNPATKKLVSDVFSRAIATIGYSLDRRSINEGSSGTNDITVPEHTQENLIPEMRAAWNFGNVMEDLGETDETQISFYHARYKNVVEKEVKLYDKKFMPTKATDSYWRGIAAFTITDIEDFSPEGNERAIKFIKWAGKHDDISLVTKLAIERNTLDVEILQAIIKEGNDASSLRGGVL